MANGRAGSDYLQSLLDGHEQVVTFNGHFLCYTEFIAESKTFQYGILEDIVDEFIGFYIYKLSSKYDIQEKKDKLGEHRNQSIIINREKFKKNLLGILEGQNLTKKLFLISVYGAYHLSLDMDLLKAKVILHHPHLKEELFKFIEDGEPTKIIVMTRDPRANLKSAIENFRSYYPKSFNNMGYLYSTIKLICDDSSYLKNLNLEYLKVRLESLPKKENLIKLSKWMGIDYQPSMQTPTWAGLIWTADRLSQKTPSLEWSKNRTYNSWNEQMGILDKFYLHLLLKPMLIKYGYEQKGINFFKALIAPLFLFFPLRYELYQLNFRNLIGSFRIGDTPQRINVLFSGVFYFKRVFLFYLIYLKNIKFEFNKIFYPVRGDEDNFI